MIRPDLRNTLSYLVDENCSFEENGILTRLHVQVSKNQIHSCTNNAAIYCFISPGLMLTITRWLSWSLHKTNACIIATVDSTFGSWQKNCVWYFTAKFDHLVSFSMQLTLTVEATPGGNKTLHSGSELVHIIRRN